MQLEKMTAKQLNSWITKLEKTLQVEDNEHNKDLYRRWLIQAREERIARNYRREEYLKRKGVK